jgi:hypothetical protein
VRVFTDEFEEQTIEDGATAAGHLRAVYQKAVWQKN